MYTTEEEQQKVADWLAALANSQPIVKAEVIAFKKALTIAQWLSYKDALGQIEAYAT